MPTRERTYEMAVLERYRMGLENSEAYPEIAASLIEMGYDTAIIAEGKALYTETRKSFDFNVREDDQTREAYSRFDDVRTELEEKYSKDKKLAKAAFRDDPEARQRLFIDGPTPKAYISFVETTDKFYFEVKNSPEILSKLSRYTYTAEIIDERIELVRNVKANRSSYYREQGESQNATQIKDEAFAKLDKWMSEFYTVARIALEDNIQLLEALGVIVRS